MALPIEIRGARTHNLRNISLDVPRNQLIVITGVSGSGKSSLAFDTLYAEGQRRYVESLSAYARQFLERMNRPEVDEIRGISPAVAIEQKNPTKGSRSTVGTATEVLDYLRLLFARIGKTVCPHCNVQVHRHQVQDVVDKLCEQFEGSNVYVCFPWPEIEGQHQTVVDLLSKGFIRALVGGQVLRLSDKATDTDIDREKALVLVDRLTVNRRVRDRLADDLNTAFLEGGGRVAVHVPDGQTIRFSQHYQCDRCGRTFLEPQPRLFSFNNPFGACARCKGFGDTIEIDENLVVPDKSQSLSDGAIAPWRTATHINVVNKLMAVANRYDIDVGAPYCNLSDRQKQMIWNGVDEYPGIYRFFDWLETKKYKIGVRVFLSRYRTYVRCPSCKGTRLREDALNVRISHKNIAEIQNMTLTAAHQFFGRLQLSGFEETIVGQILAELRNRLRYLNDIGLGYLSLNRRTATLSGGEFQRINLASALGSQLVGSLYILDEPTIGLHPRDTQRLIKILCELRDMGNTVVVVEHDRDVITSADRVIDLGPMAGESGGEIVYQGDYAGLRVDGRSLTGYYLRGNKQIPTPDERRSLTRRSLMVVGASEHNLKKINVRIPLGVMTVVTGVSGSGKSSLVHDVLYTALLRVFGKWQKRVGKHEHIEGAHLIDDVVLVDQSPIGKTPRSNPATYVKAFGAIRQLFSESVSARAHGLKPGSFSFNVSGGRCDVCQGAGAVKVEMQFLADLFLQCDACGGKRYKKEVLNVRLRGKNVVDVLNMSVNEAISFFKREPQVLHKLRLLADVGLGYMKLGQPATTLSGGEAQRVKLAAHLGERAGKHILYIFDEPTTGLHFDDVATLLRCFDWLVDRGNSVLVIEHNLDVIKCADYVIDLGPGGGEAGGQVVAQGRPEDIMANPSSVTGAYLNQYQ